MEPRKYPLHTFVKLTFVDSSYIKGWHQQQGGDYSFGEDRVVTAQAAGWVVECDWECIGVCTSLTDDGGALNPFFVPWGAIREIEEVKL